MDIERFVLPQYCTDTLKLKLGFAALMLSKNWEKVVQLGHKINNVTQNNFAEYILPMVIDSELRLNQNNQTSMELLKKRRQEKSVPEEALYSARNTLAQYINNILQRNQKSSTDGTSVLPVSAGMTDASKALVDYQKAIESSRQIQHTKLTVTALNEFGDIFAGHGSYKQAVVAWEAALDQIFGDPDVTSHLSQFVDNPKIVNGLTLWECIMVLQLLAKLAQYASHFSMHSIMW